MMLDGMREVVDPALPTQRQRLASERLLLQLAAGAASDRLYVSYPRIELSESRARVPSFYALDVMRAATGRVTASRRARTASARSGRRDARVAGAVDAGRGDRRSGARPRGAATAARRDESGRGQGTRALPVETERVPSAIGRRPMGARPAPLVSERWADARSAVHERGAGGAASEQHARTRHPRCNCSARVRISSCSRRCTGCGRSSSPSHCSGWIR